MQYRKEYDRKVFWIQINEKKYPETTTCSQGASHWSTHEGDKQILIWPGTNSNTVNVIITVTVRITLYQ